jgi:hypothetical protein
MPKKAPIITIEEKPGDKYPSLEAAQQAALPLMSASLQAVIRDLLERGVLAEVNGKIIPICEEKQNE